MTTLERMIRIAPVHLYCRPDGFYCDWSVDCGKNQHARGVGVDPGTAIYRAWTDARKQGWAEAA